MLRALSKARCADDNEFQQGASRGTVQAMINDKSAEWDMYTLWGDVSYARHGPSPGLSWLGDGQGSGLGFSGVMQGCGPPAPAVSHGAGAKRCTSAGAVSPHQAWHAPLACCDPLACILSKAALASG